MHAAPLPRALATLLLLWPLSGRATSPGVTVVEGQFHTPSGVIPAGCLVQMKPQLNGDELIASVILEVDGKKGCMNARHPYPEPLQDPEAGPPTYSIEKSLGNDVYRIKACEGVSGSMGRSCSTLLVQFSERDFGGKTARVVQHRGRGSTFQPPFDPDARVAEIRKRYRAVAGNTSLQTNLVKSGCTNPGLTGEEPYGGRETLYRKVDGAVGEIHDEITTLYGTESVQFLLKDGAIWFAFLEVRNESIPAMGIEPGYDTDTRVYFENEVPFLCKLTYPTDAPAGSPSGEAQVVPCAELPHMGEATTRDGAQRKAETSAFADDIGALLAHGKALLAKAKVTPHPGHADWCKEGGSL